MADINRYIYVQDKSALRQSDGVYIATQGEFAGKLEEFLKKFSRQDQRQPLPLEHYPAFPFVEFEPLKNEIFTRREDLRLLEENFGDYLKPDRTVLEIGGWNGWLTRFLHEKDMNVLSMDIFIDEVNGLKSRRHHRDAGWLSLQADVSEPGLLKPEFDLIVFNHCLQFYTQPTELVKRYRPLLKKNGLLLVLGASFFGDPAKKQKEVQEGRSRFFQRSGFDPQFYPSKGFFSVDDLRSFREQGFRFTSYRLPIKTRIKKLYRGDKEGLLYAPA